MSKREERNARNRASYAANPEKHRARRRASYAANPEKYRARGLKYYAEKVSNNPIRLEAKRKYQQERRLADPERVRSIERKWKRIRNYNLTPNDWELLFEIQGRVCACCGSPDPGYKKGWATDHDHKTGHFRGILCPPCNSTIGFARESSARLRAAADYLERSS